MYKRCFCGLRVWDQVQWRQKLCLFCGLLCMGWTVTNQQESPCECLLTRYTPTDGLRLWLTKKLTICCCCLFTHFTYPNVLGKKKFLRDGIITKCCVLCNLKSIICHKVDYLLMVNFPYEVLSLKKIDKV